MKRILMIFLVVMVLLSNVVYAGEEYFKFTRSTDTLNVSGKTLEMYKYNNSNYASPRAIIEAFGGTVEYNNGIIAASLPQAPKIDLDKLKDSVVMIDAEKEIGSGLVWDYGKILTCYHVVDNSNKNTAVYQSGNSSNLSKLKDITNIDVSVLKSENSTLKPVKIGDSDEVKKDDTVIAVVSPGGNINTVIKGKITGFDTFKGQRGIQTDIKATNGSSGGALFDSNGCLIGIIRAYDPAIQRSLAIPINDVRKALAN